MRAVSQQIPGAVLRRHPGTGRSRFFVIARRFSAVAIHEAAPRLRLLACFGAMPLEMTGASGEPHVALTSREAP